MQASRSRLGLLTLGSLLTLLLVAWTGSAAQTPECAKASLARSTGAKDYPQLQERCV